MQVDVSKFPRSITGAQTMADEKEEKPKTWVTELNRWLQALSILAGILLVGMTVEHRLTTIENKYDAANSSIGESVKAQKEQNGLMLLLIESEKTSFEIMLKMKLPKDDKKKAEDMLTKINNRKISENDHGFDAGGAFSTPRN